MRGFTIVEILIVVSVIAVLASLFMQNSQAGVLEARAVACEKNRVLCEDMEQQFEHRRGRPTITLLELVDAGYVNKARCPQGGILTWMVEDPQLPGAHQALVCSIHGVKTRIRAATPVPEAGSDYALSDSFSGLVASGWAEARGKYWQVIDGVYRAGTTTRKRSGAHRSFSGNENWKDYDVTVDATLVQGNGYGVFFRATDTRKVNGYLFEYDPDYKKGSFVIREFRNGRQKKVLAHERAPKGYDWTGRSRSVRVEVRGSTFTAFVDGKQVVSATDGRHKTGAVGLLTRNKAVADFDNVRVEIK